MVHDKLLLLISKHVVFDAAAIDLVQTYFEPVRYKKNEILEQAPAVAQYLYFINSGFIRVFYEQDGEEITTHINCPPGFITSFTSFISGSPAPDIVSCITGCEVLRITKDKLALLSESIPKWDEFSKMMYEKSLNYNEQRTKDMLALNAEQRYRKLLHEYPEILHHVPLHYISSYIGIAPQSLSRIRRAIIS